MKVKTILMTAFIVLSVATYAFAVEGHGHNEHSEAVPEGGRGSMMGQEHKGSMMGHMKEEASSAIEVGNKVCPVSGEKVGGMGPVVQHEYKGKVYNFCCAGCVETFKKDPEKYIKIVEESMEQKNAKEGSHDHSKHVMGEMDSHVMKEMHDEQKAHSMAVAENTKNAKGEVREVHLEAYQFSFSPDTIVVNKGDSVKIHATSRDVPHGIFIEEYGINILVKKGAVEEIEFVADKAGEFDIICSVYCGKGHHSMKAKLIVKE